MKTVLYNFVNSIINKIENGFDDVATLTPDIDGIPFKMKDWIQISGPLFYGGAKNDDIYVCICLDGCNSDRLDIYQKFGYRKEKNDAGVTKYYKWNEANKIAYEVEEIVVALVGESIANTFVSDDVFIEISKRQLENARTSAKQQKRNTMIIYICIAIFTPIILFLLAWIMGEI